MAGFWQDFGTVTFFLNGNVYNGVFVRNSRGPDTQRVLGTQIDIEFLLFSSRKRTDLRGKLMLGWEKKVTPEIVKRNEITSGAKLALAIHWDR